MTIIYRALSLFTLPFSLLIHATEPSQLVIGTRAGYHDLAPTGTILGIYGGLQLSPTWIWDVGYQYHDDLETKNDSVNVKTWLIESALRYDWYIQDNVSLFGRLGTAYWWMTKTHLSLNKQNANGFSPLGEVGVNYNFTSNLSLSAGYQYVDGIGKSDIGKYDSHGLMLGLTYTFDGEGQSALVETVSEPVQEIVVVEPVPKVLTFPSKSTDIAFDIDSNVFRQDEIESLYDVASALKHYPQSRVVIVGHTDSTGSKSYNQALSEKRAQVVVDKVIELGVPSTQLEWHGEGELIPVADNNTSEGRATNRRVEVIPI